MFEYVLNRVHYDHKNKAWVLDENIGVFDSLDKALNAQMYDKTNTQFRYQYYIEHRIKLDYAGSN